MYGKEAAGLAFGCEEFTDLLSFPVMGDIQMILAQLSLVRSLFPVMSPGNWEHLPAKRFKDYPSDGWVIVSLNMFGDKSLH